MKLQGIFVDAATPFDHAGNLYRVKIEHNIGKWNRTSVAGYVVGGFTGEGALLSGEEKGELWKIAAANAGEGKALVAGVDAAGAQVAAELANRAGQAGFAAALVETPHCEPAMRRRETQLLFFRSVADRSAIPILISNRPRVTGVDLDSDTILTLAGHPNIAGLVDHSGDTGKIGGLRGFAVLCGVEAGVRDALAEGAAGAVLPFANAAPYASIALWEAHRTREDEASLDWQSRITAAAAVADRFGVAGLKHAMDLNGYYGGPPRLPWPAVGPGAKVEIQRAFADLKS